MVINGFHFRNPAKHISPIFSPGLLFILLQFLRLSYRRVKSVFHVASALSKENNKPEARFSKAPNIPQEKVK